MDQPVPLPAKPPSWLSKLGPGLITGAADDDPSGIATYSQAGAQFGFGLLWTLLFTYPLMVGIQVVSARIGIVTGDLQPVVVSKQLRNVPEKGVFSWEPGALLGLYRVDEFYYAPAQGR